MMASFLVLWPVLKTLGLVLGPIIGTILVYFYGKRDGTKDAILERAKEAQAIDANSREKIKTVLKLEAQRDANIENIRISPIDGLVRMWNEKQGAGSKSSSNDPSNP